MKKITEFVNEIPEEKGNRKTISLYKLIKTNCPQTIRSINKRLNGKSIINKLKHNKNWYIVIINYLTKNEILRTEKTDIGTFHNVTEDYIEYFNVPKSTVFSQNNFPTHLMLYKDSVETFLKETGLKNKEGKEYFEEEKKEDEIKINKKIQKYLKILAFSLLSWSLLQFGIMTAKYGYNNMIPIIINSILFAISLILIINDKDSK